MKRAPYRDFDNSEFDIIDAPARPHGVIEATLVYGGRSVPLIEDEEDDAELEREPETDCCLCTYPVFEEDAVNTADGIAHESCAERIWPTGQGDR